jgi:hypothetical protein
MIRRLVSRFRLVAPPGWAVVVWLVLFVVCEGPILYLERQVGMPLQLRFRPGWSCLIIASVLLGFYRAVAFHPFFQGDYLRWLKSTPWTVRKPLPAGPVELVLEDSLAIGALMFLSLTQPGGGSIEVLNAFLFTHAAILVRTFWRTAVPGFGYCGALFLGFVPRLWAQPWIDLAVLTSIYLFVHEGLWRSLARFPWPTEGVSDDQDPGVRIEREYGPSCGWPYDRFHRDVRMARGIGRGDAILISMLTGWWFFALGAWISTQWLSPFLFMLAIALLMRRSVLYFQGYESPISFGGRIATFRWIIPGYDQAALFVLLTPLAIAAVTGLMMYFQLEQNQSLPALASLVVLIALTTPPTLRRWRLTGQHRLVPAIPKASQDYVQVG